MNAPSATGSGFHLAQVNIARPLAPLNSPVMQGFTEAIGAMNALAERSPGFVWRLVGSPEADAETERVFQDPALLVTLSVWESVETLRAYAMQSAHGTFLRRRAEWFHPADGPNYALCWIPRAPFPRWPMRTNAWPDWHSTVRLPRPLGSRNRSRHQARFESPHTPHWA